MRRPLLCTLTLVAYVPFALDGCVSIRTRHDGPAPSRSSTTGAFRFLAVQKAHDRGDVDRAAGAVLASLSRLRDGEEQVVWRGTRGDWTVRDLPAGRYRLRVERVYDGEGKAKDPRGDSDKDFEIRPGEALQANVVLQKTPWGLVVALSLTVVLVVALLVILARSGDIQLPDAGDLGGLLPPIPPLSPEAVDLTLAFIRLGEDESVVPADEEEEGKVVSYSPHDGDAGILPRSPVDVTLDTAVDPHTVDQRTFGLFAEHVQIPAAIAVRDHGRHLHLEPLRPLPEGVEVTARLMGSHIHSSKDNDGEGSGVCENYEWRFVVRGQ